MAPLFLPWRPQLGGLIGAESLIDEAARGCADLVAAGRHWLEKPDRHSKNLYNISVVVAFLCTPVLNNLIIIAGTN
jgi:hypothetical protein